MTVFMHAIVNACTVRLAKWPVRSERYRHGLGLSLSSSHQLQQRREDPAIASRTDEARVVQHSTMPCSNNWLDNSCSEGKLPPQSADDDMSTVVRPS